MRNIKYIRLHSIMHVPNVGQLDVTFPQSGAKTLKDLVMYKDGDGAFISFTHKGNKIDLFFPSGNIVGMQLEPDETKSSS